MLANESEPTLFDDGQVVAATAAATAAADGQFAGQLDPVYAQFRDQTRFWIQRVAVPMIMVVGLFGNLITVIIMTRRRMRSTTNMYLAALAFVDMLYLVLTFLLGLSHYPNVARRRYYLYWRLKPFLMMLTDSCSNTSVWLTVTFTIERFIAVRYPIKGKVWCTEARAKRLIVCVFIFAILFTLPTPFEWKVVERRVPTAAPIEATANVSQVTGDTVSKIPPIIGGNTAQLMPPPNISPISEQVSRVKTEANHDDGDNDNDQVFMALEYSDFGSNDTYKTIYYWSTAAIFYFIPLLSLTFFNGFLIHSVHQSRRERNKMTNQRAAVKSAKTSVLDERNEASVAKGGKLFAASKKSKHLGGDANPAMIEKFVAKIPSDSLPEVKFKVIGELANQDNNSEADSSAQKFQRTIMNNHQQTDCDKRDSNLLGGIFVDASEPDTSSLKAAHHQQLTSALGTRSAPLMERASDLKGTSDDAITRLSLLATDNTSALRGGSLKANIREKGARGAGRNGAGACTLLTASPPSQLVSLDSSLTNNHSSCSSYNESATPGHQATTIAPASSQERRITIMLISVVILFLVCQIPTAAMLLYTSVHETIPNTNEQALQLALGNIFNFLMAVNAAGNFILYSFLSKKYRRTFVILFCGCLRRARKKRHDNNSTRTKLSQCPSTSQQTGKSSTTINTSSSLADEPTTKAWASVLFYKTSKAPALVDTKRVLI